MEKTSGVFTLEIKEKEYEVCFDLNAICWFEENLNESFDEVQARMMNTKLDKKGNPVKFRVTDVRNMLAASLQYHALQNDKEEMSLFEVKKLLAGANIEKIMNSLMVGLD